MKTRVVARTPVTRELTGSLGVLLKRRTQRVAQVVGQRIAEVTLALVDDAEIKRLNRRYRKHDRVTDVLSFTYQAAPVAGELVICLPQAARQAQRQGHSLKRELEVLVVHGLLHLAGYDHVRAPERAVMRAAERAVLR